MISDTIFINGSDTSSCQVTSKKKYCSQDPLGFFSPATLNGKLFVQELWKQELDWDKTLCESKQQEWWKLHDDFILLSSLAKPRYLEGDEYKPFCFTAC